MSSQYGRRDETCPVSTGGVGAHPAGGSQADFWQYAPKPSPTHAHAPSRHVPRPLHGAPPDQSAGRGHVRAATSAHAAVPSRTAVTPNEWSSPAAASCSSTARAPASSPPAGPSGASRHPSTENSSCISPAARREPSRVTARRCSRSERNSAPGPQSALAAAAHLLGREGVSVQ